MKRLSVWFNWLHIGVLAALLPLFVFPKVHLWWVLLVVPLLWAARYALKKEFLTRTPMDVPLFVFIAALTVNCFQVPDFNHSLSKIAGLAFGIAFMLAITGLLKTGNLLTWGTFVFLLGGFFFSLIGVLGMPTFTVKHLDLLMKLKQKIPRIDFKLPGAEQGFSTNAVGGILLLVVPLFFVLLIYAWLYRTNTLKSRITLLFLFSGLSVTGLVLLLTQSRGAWAGLFFSTVIIGVSLGVRQIKRKRVVIIAIIAFMVTAMIAGMLYYTRSNAKGLKPGLKQVEGTMQFRFHLWNIALPVVRANPLWGTGLNNFRRVTEVRYDWSSAHNQLLHVAAEMGIPAAVAYLALLMAAGLMCIEISKINTSHWLKYAAIGLGWGQLAFLFFGITDAIPPGAKVGIFFWLSLAMITAVYSFLNSKHRVE